MPRKWFRTSSADSIFCLIIQVLFSFVAANVFFPMTVMASDTILPGHQNEIYQRSNRKEFQNGANINTEFEVITKQPPIEPAIPPSINIDFLLSATEAFNGEIKQHLSTTDRDPDQYWKSLLDTVSEKKSDDDVRNSHHQEPLTPIQYLDIKEKLKPRRTRRMNSEMHTCKIEAKMNCKSLQHGLDCEDIQSRESPHCLVEVLYSFNVVNTGTSDVFLTSLLFTDNSGAVAPIYGKHGPTYTDKGGILLPAKYEMNERKISLLNFCKRNTMDWGTEISFAVTAQPNQGGNQCSSTNHYDYIPTPKGAFSPNALSSSKPSELPTMETSEMPSNAPSPFLWPSNKRTSTKCNISLGTTCMVIEDGSDCRKIKRHGGNEKCLVQIKYMHSIQNTGSIDYSLNIVSVSQFGSMVDLSSKVVLSTDYGFMVTQTESVNICEARIVLATTGLIAQALNGEQYCLDYFQFEFTIGTIEPTTSPTVWPSEKPSRYPSEHPTISLSNVPTYFQTNVPSMHQSSLPSVMPSKIFSSLPSKSLVPSLSPYSSPSAVPSEEPTFSPTSVCDILLTTTCEAVEDGSDCRNGMLQEDKDDCLKDIKYLLSVVNTGSTDVINKEISVTMMSKAVDLSENFTDKKLPRHFGYFTSATMTIDVCTPHLHMATISVIAEPAQGGKPCSNEIQYTFSLVTPRSSLSPTSLLSTDSPSTLTSDLPSERSSGEPSAYPILKESSRPSGQPSSSLRPSLLPSEPPSCEILLVTTCETVSEGRDCRYITLNDATSSCLVDVVYTHHLINMGYTDIFVDTISVSSPWEVTNLPSGFTVKRWFGSWIEIFVTLDVCKLRTWEEIVLVEAELVEGGQRCTETAKYDFSIVLAEPSSFPSNNPSKHPSVGPSEDLSGQPSLIPSEQSKNPSGQPSKALSENPSEHPSATLSRNPSGQPSLKASFQPSSLPSTEPSPALSDAPTATQSSLPSYSLSSVPSTSLIPSLSPYQRPSASLSDQPTSSPTANCNLMLATTCKTLKEGVDCRYIKLLKGTDDCWIDIEHTYNLINTGSTDVIVQGVSIQRLGEVVEFIDGTKSIMLPSKLALAAREELKINVCNVLTLVATVNATAQPVQGGKSCSAFFQNKYRAVTQNPTPFPSTNPSVNLSVLPSDPPSAFHSGMPSKFPSQQPSLPPSHEPSRVLSHLPSFLPSLEPSYVPSMIPTQNPSNLWSNSPTYKLSVIPSLQSSMSPSLRLSKNPSRRPSLLLSSVPSRNLSQFPSILQSSSPSIWPSLKPSREPSEDHSFFPSLSVSQNPSINSSLKPSESKMPSSFPSIFQSASPSGHPTANPSYDCRVSASISCTTLEHNIDCSKTVLRKSTDNCSVEVIFSYEMANIGSADVYIVPYVSRYSVHKPKEDVFLYSTSLKTFLPSGFGYAISNRAVLDACGNEPFVVIQRIIAHTIQGQQSCSDTALLAISPITMEPTSAPSLKPSFSPSESLSLDPSVGPSQGPSDVPTSLFSEQLSSHPTQAHSLLPSHTPSILQSMHPSSIFSMDPTETRSLSPSVLSSQYPSAVSSAALSIKPSGFPSNLQTFNPSFVPSEIPSSSPSIYPSILPTTMSSPKPSATPTIYPSDRPSRDPSIVPSNTPSLPPSLLPSWQPRTSPSIGPSMKPSFKSSAAPSSTPSTAPTDSSMVPSWNPSNEPSIVPSKLTSKKPSNKPSDVPSNTPSLFPTKHPSENLTELPSTFLSESPSQSPSVEPISVPSSHPSVIPSLQPSGIPSDIPSSTPSFMPTLDPSMELSMGPSEEPSILPTKVSSSAPSTDPSSLPSDQPTTSPTYSCDISLEILCDTISGVDCKHLYRRETDCLVTLLYSYRVTNSGLNHVRMKRLSRRYNGEIFDFNYGDTTMLPSGFGLALTESISIDICSVHSVEMEGKVFASPTQGGELCIDTELFELTFLTDKPTSKPSLGPSSTPSLQPSDYPSSFPTLLLSKHPSNEPSLYPSEIPSLFLSEIPSLPPSSIPSVFPTQTPSTLPSSQHSYMPSEHTSIIQSMIPSKIPSVHPSEHFSEGPSYNPTSRPTLFPSLHPSLKPSKYPSTIPSQLPTFVPTTQASMSPSKTPTSYPSITQTLNPSHAPSDAPALLPSGNPSKYESSFPSEMPSDVPSSSPSDEQSLRPSKIQSFLPSILLSISPSGTPSNASSETPTQFPTILPSFQSSAMPIIKPSTVPSPTPTRLLSNVPSAQPTDITSQFPSDMPSVATTHFPSYWPSHDPSLEPSKSPPAQFSAVPSALPTPGPSTTTIFPVQSIIDVPMTPFELSFFPMPNVLTSQGMDEFNKVFDVYILKNLPISDGVDLSTTVLSQRFEKEDNGEGRSLQENKQILIVWMKKTAHITISPYSSLGDSYPSYSPELDPETSSLDLSMLKVFNEYAQLALVKNLRMLPSPQHFKVLTEVNFVAFRKEEVPRVSPPGATNKNSSGKTFIPGLENKIFIAVITAAFIIPCALFGWLYKKKARMSGGKNKEDVDAESLEWDFDDDDISPLGLRSSGYISNTKEDRKKRHTRSTAGSRTLSYSTNTDYSGKHKPIKTKRTSAEPPPPSKSKRVSSLEKSQASHAVDNQKHTFQTMQSSKSIQGSLKERQQTNGNPQGIVKFSKSRRKQDDETSTIID